MNDISFITEYAVPIIVGICLCIGYVIKNIVTSEKVNKYIPLIMAVLGVGLNIWINMDFTPAILLGGLISGLASTGLHQAFKNIIERKDG